ncbi:hypothetical protein [Algiphilus sp.]|uniref:hypothetical protein n=1 Tax=Algiphilus sp. TaxID=1872431 RepID=UPI001CA6FF6D|nr:hypothetical protein [Algiphilus sp.]MBY8966649.1 hypothetical protein [Algiphilus acroporae]MCI5061919.1 hypothetical protein [Algiphilus sp.]MCI5102135.1 hypothetical protein [Algiphilus sp.]MCR9090422.1 hypothetical protein [Pseudomonadota bacterium]
MRFEQVKDVLNHVIAFHCDVACDYADMAAQTEDVRLKMLLAYLQEHVRSARKGLEGYIHGDAQPVLNTWLQNAPALEHPQLLDALRKDLDVASVDTVASVAEKIQETLGDMFRTLAAQADTDGVRELFSALAAFQAAEVRRLARDTARFNS